MEPVASDSDDGQRRRPVEEEGIGKGLASACSDRPRAPKTPVLPEPEVGIEPTTCCLQAAIRLSIECRQRPSRQGFRTNVSRTIPPKSVGVRHVRETNGETHRRQPCEATVCAGAEIRRRLPRRPAQPDYERGR